MDRIFANKRPPPKPATPAPKPATPAPKPPTPKPPTPKPATPAPTPAPAPAPKPATPAPAPVTTAQTAALLTKQFTVNSDITTILNTALDTLLTNPEYQKQQISSELQQNLQEAQLNAQTAPLQLEKAKKYYYVYTQGRQYYNTMIETQLENQATQITQQLTNKFNEEVQNAQTMNAYFSANQINAENTIELYDE